MLTSLVLAALLLATGTFAYLKANRLRLYRQLEGLQQQILVSTPSVAFDAADPPPQFDELLAQIDKALPEATFETIRAEVEQLVTTERSYLPTHKKGGTVAYETLCNQAPAVISVYLNPEFHAFLSRIVGEPLKPTPINDQSSCSILFYEKPGDHIGWHYDHNFYRGRHFTVLVPIVNRGHSTGGLSEARLQARMARGDISLPTPPNSLVIFEGGKVLHKVTPIADGERRIILSMTFCTDPSSTLMQGLKRRIKDTAFFGVRALWT